MIGYGVEKAGVFCLGEVVWLLGAADGDLVCFMGVVVGMG